MALVPNGAKEGQLMMLFETYGERYTQRRLQAYAEDLAAVELEVVAEAIRTWRRAQPAHVQAPSPAELVALCRQLATPRAVQVPLEVATAPRPDLDAIFAELAREHPDNRILQQRISERVRAPAHGPEGPGASADIPAPPAPVCSADPH